MKFTPRSIYGIGFVFTVLLLGLVLTFFQDKKASGPNQSKVLRIKIKKPALNNQEKAKGFTGDQSSAAVIPAPDKSGGAKIEKTVEKEKETFVSVQSLVPKELFSYEASTPRFAVLDKQDPPSGKIGHDTPGTLKGSDPDLRGEKLKYNQLSGIKAEETNGEFTLSLSFAGSINSYNSFTLNAPPRFIIDLSGKWRVPRDSDVKVEGEIAGSVRLGKHPDFLRVVIDLTGEVSAEPIIRKSSSQFIVIIRKAHLRSAAKIQGIFHGKDAY